MIDLTKLEPAEAERLAHAEGFTGVAALYARLSDAEAIVDQVREVLDDVHLGGISPAQAIHRLYEVLK